MNGLGLSWLLWLVQPHMQPTQSVSSVLMLEQCDGSWRRSIGAAMHLFVLYCCAVMYMLFSAALNMGLWWRLS